MNTFSSIKDLLLTLVREHKLLADMFEKRKKLSYKYDYALEIVEYKEERLQFLINHSVIKENGNYVEIDDQFLEFFEQVLEVNEDINVSSINENIKTVKENIVYYLQENNEARKYNYLRIIKNTLRKLGNVALRNVIDLKRNIEDTFKTEPNYKIKKTKLENFDIKRIDISRFIDYTYKLIEDDEQAFFKFAIDDELKRIITILKLQLNECSHNIIEIQRQIIEFLNQIKYQGNLVEKIRKVKYLKDQFTIRATTDIESLIGSNNAVIFENNPSYPLKLSIAYLQEANEVKESIEKIAKKIKSNVIAKRLIAGTISDEYLENSIINEHQINLEEVRNSFLASSNNLFDFVMQYPFSKETSFDERVTIYCQLVSQYEDVFNIKETYETIDNIEFVMVYPK